MKLYRGYISPYFITNQKSQKCELEDPLIMIHEKKISNVNTMVKVLEMALKTQRPLLIVAEDIDSDALATLILNKLRLGIKVCAIKVLVLGRIEKPICRTLPLSLLIIEELGLNLEKVEPYKFGSCKKGDSIKRCEQVCILTVIITMLFLMELVTRRLLKRDVSRLVEFAYYPPDEDIITSTSSIHSRRG